MMKILLAEDERSLSRASVKILEKYGYTVIPAYNGEEALQKIKTEYFDLILLDVMMPKKNGLEVLKELRAMGNEIKVIMLTAKSEISDKIEGLDSGANDYITKPFDYNELNARIKVIERELSKKNIYDIGDLMLDENKMIIYQKRLHENGCTLTTEEVRILKLFKKEHNVSKNILLAIFDNNEEKLNLYIKYLNNKLHSLSENMSLTLEHETLRLTFC